MKQPCVYMLASGWNGTLYIGVTSDLIQRIWQHKSDFVEGFTRTYRVHDLVWYEQHGNMESAPARESHQGMEASMEDRADRALEPKWQDLYPDLLR